MGSTATRCSASSAKKGRSLELTEDRLWKMGYGSEYVHLLFNLWCRFNYTPAYANNLPQVDH